MSRWYKVEFYGKPPEGQEPTTGQDWDELLVVAGKLAEPFGFERIDDIKVIPCGTPEDFSARIANVEKTIREAQREAQGE